jgi:hypothetical protein
MNTEDVINFVKGAGEVTDDFAIDVVDLLASLEPAACLTFIQALVDESQRSGTAAKACLLALNLRMGAKAGDKLSAALMRVHELKDRNAKQAAEETFRTAVHVIATQADHDVQALYDAFLSLSKEGVEAFLALKESGTVVGLAEGAREAVKRLIAYDQRPSKWAIVTTVHPRLLTLEHRG